MANNNSSNNNNRGSKNGKNGGFRGVLTLIVWALVLTVAFQYFNAYNNNAANKSTSHEIKYSDMISMIEKDQVEEVLFKDSTIYVTPVDGYVFTEEVTSGSKTETKTYTQSKDSGLTLYTVYLSNADLLPLLEEHNVAYTGFYKAEMSPFLMIMIQYILPTIFIVGAFMLVMRLMSKSGGGGFGGIGSVGKANAKVYMEKSTGVTFKDVAGQDEAKESLEEIIDFLHNPGKYTAIGAKLPKGALLVGLSYAKGLAYAANKPFIGADHIAGHIAANYLSYPDLQPPFVCLVASGGHSHIILVEGYNSFKLLGCTRDDAAGEAFDKVARALGLNYPGGPELEKLAREGNANAYSFRGGFNESDSLDFSFSGIKTAVVNLMHNAEQKGETLNRADIAASFQRSVVDTLCQKAVHAAKLNNVSTLALAGGVSANTALRTALEKAAHRANLRFCRPDMRFCTDNAAMIACAAHYALLESAPSPLSLNAEPSKELAE